MLSGRSCIRWKSGRRFKKHELMMSLQKKEGTWRSDVDCSVDGRVEYQVGGEGDQARTWLCLPWRIGYRGWASIGRRTSSDTIGSRCIN